MPVTIPLTAGEPFFSFSTRIDDTNYLFDVRWNARHAMWYFNLLDEDENLISANNAIALGSTPLKYCSHPDRPVGVFIVADQSDSGVEATFEDLGIRVVLEFWTFEELTG